MHLCNEIDCLGMKSVRKTFLLLAAVCLIGLCCNSCKKSEEEAISYKYMEGTVEVADVPSYVVCNELLTMTLGGITYPENPSYKWLTDRNLYADTLHAETITLQMPDSLAQYKFTVYADAGGFYQSFNTFSITAIDTSFNGSLTGLVKSGCSIFDDRDGQSYPYVTIGSLDWFSRNLSYSGTGIPFKNSPAMHSLFGRYYTWDEATGGVSGEGLGCGPQGACPEGWSVPTNEDWVDLAVALSGDPDVEFTDEWPGLAECLSADAYFREERMWPYSPQNEHANIVGWNAIPTGAAILGGKDYTGINAYGFWWSATQKNDKQAYYRYQHYDTGNFPMNYTDKNSISATVRCVRIAR